MDDAKKQMADAVNKVEGFKADIEEDIDSLKKKVDAAKKVASGDITALEDAGVSKEVADIAKKEAVDLINNVNKVKNVFKDNKQAVDLAKSFLRI